ncbi:MAG TPA: S8 family serine peptidase [bacterium]|jgi:translation initiation factor 2 beta subunit (eIF-2beta)/eIF-5|nr:S8 family serine peptidase [bacterium]HNZ51182.1 S8 family serine peptidase [bacterium]HOF79644.1 S8 family serine peptidase [bacterium]HOH85525.1 S8 family serine peptidase [bacterium]HOQ91781.1 S8 family serine peptidase [bacterium]
MNFEKINNHQELIIDRFADLRGRNLSQQNLSMVSADILKTAEFDTATIWPKKEKLPTAFNPEKLLLDGKNPGLGIKKLHQQGIDGRGVVVAILDQGLDINHPEYKDSLIDYQTRGIDSEPISMHGPAVASLLVGKDCGVAPEAKLVYRGSPGRNLKLHAQNLEDIIKANESRPDNEKIRVVSCSFGHTAITPGLTEWLVALKKAQDSGLIVINTNNDQIGVNFTGGGSLENKDDPDSYSEFLYNELHNNIFADNDIDKILLRARAYHSDKDISDEELKTEIITYVQALREKKSKSPEILVPSDHRTMASSWSKRNQYMHQGRGGISWSVPYLAGVFALVLQIKPELKQAEISRIIVQTATINKQGLRIINPRGVIDEVKRLS